MLIATLIYQHNSVRLLSQASNAFFVLILINNFFDCYINQLSRCICMVCVFIICCFFFFFVQPPLDDHLADIVDDEWRQEQLPHEQIWVPSEKLPDPEADNGDSHLTLLEQVNFDSLALCTLISIHFFSSILHKILLLYFPNPQEQRWTDLSLANLTPELAMTDQINISSS